MKISKLMYLMSLLNPFFSLRGMTSKNHLRDIVRARLIMVVLIVMFVLLFLMLQR